MSVGSLRGGISNALAAAVGVVMTLASAQQNPEPTPSPARDIGLVERAGVRLQQIDITVTGPPTQIEDLGPADFDVQIGWTTIRDFTVDRLCRGVDAQPAPSTVSPFPSPPSAEPTATFVFYFDQPHLTMAGRARAIEVAKDLADRLVVHGNRAMILSNARDLRTIQPLTSDPRALADALDRMKTDREQWDTAAAEEESHVVDVLDALAANLGGPPLSSGRPSKQATSGSSSTPSSMGGRVTTGSGRGDNFSEIFPPRPDPIAESRNGGLLVALGLADNFQSEEAWRQERDLGRLEMVLGRLANLNPPKVFLYFADTMRANPGEHYLSLFSDQALAGTLKGKGVASAARGNADAGRSNLDRVVSKAGALGIRFYTIEGARPEMNLVPIAAARAGSPAAMPTAFARSKRHRDAQDALAELALQTGGVAFLNDVPAEKVAHRIDDELSCIYLISFDPRDLPKDKPMTVRVTPLRPKITARSRGRIVIQSDSALLSTRLLGAFLAPESTPSDVALRVGLLPLRFENGGFRVRVQVIVPATKSNRAVWDLGISLVSRGRVTEQASGRIVIDAAGVSVIFESELTFAPGPYELIAVAHDVLGDRVASTRSDGMWPDPSDDQAGIGPLAVVQPINAAFARDGETRRSGNLVYGESDRISADQPTAVVGVVCRSGSVRGPVRIERSLVGETEVNFPVTEFPNSTSEPCVPIRDLVPPRTLGEGLYRYVVRVYDQRKELAIAERSIAVSRQR